MASRYPTTKVLDYCLNPVRLVRDNEVLYVPCGKCNGCLLHKANKWSMRLGSEIEDNKFAIFYTLTYSNKYLPTFRLIGKDYDDVYRFDVYTCHHSHNIRFDGVKDVLRKEDFTVIKCPSSFAGVPATNYVCDTKYFAYSSKRDFQLYLKLLRKDLDELYEKGYFSQVKEKEQTRFRSFAISEYGETLLRPHVHGIILPYHPEVADYLCNEGLYKSWQMCDKGYFSRYTHFCDSGAKGYVTQYLTMSSNLPSVYKDNREIRPWRLSSKASAIGYNFFDKKKVFEDFIRGVDYYYKDISRIDERYILRYPSDFGARLFPKCFEYRKKDFEGLYRVYSVFWHFRRNPRWQGSAFLLDRLFETVNPADVQAAKTCFKTCEEMNIHPYTYVYALDMFYYKKDMSALKIWYEWQQLQTDKYAIIKSYQNLYSYVHGDMCQLLEPYQRFVYSSFVAGFNFLPSDLYWLKDIDFVSSVNKDYACEVSEILKDMVKIPKFNEKYGLSPNSVY